MTEPVRKTIREQLDELDEFSDDTEVDDSEAPTEEHFVRRAREPELEAGELNQAHIKTVVVRLRTKRPG